MQARTFRTRTRDLNTKSLLLAVRFLRCDDKTFITLIDRKRLINEVKSVNDKQPMKSTTENVTSR